MAYHILLSNEVDSVTLFFFSLESIIWNNL